jgi:cytoskeletal protein CcmA (bactofilin family)
VNGSVVLAENAVVSEGVDAVNGKLTLRRGARVEGRLANVNGDLRLEGATIGGGIETASGDVLVGAGSRVESGIRVEKSRGWSSKNHDRPRVTIESGAVVNGTLEFEREVDLYVGANAVVGPVQGVAPQRHALP